MAFSWSLFCVKWISSKWKEERKIGFLRSMHAHFALFCRSTLNSAHNIFCRALFLFFNLGHALMMPTYYFYFLSSCQVYFGSCCSLIAALTLLSANWYSLLDFYFSLVNARCDSYFTLFATSFSPLAAYRLLLFVAARCWFLASCWSLLATRCSLPHICEVDKKKRVGQLVNSKFLKIRKQKKSTQCRQRK